MIVAIQPPKEILEKYKVKGGLQVNDMHITLFHMEEDMPIDQFADLISVLMDFTRIHSFLNNSKIVDVGRFENVKQWSGCETMIEGPVDVIYLKADGSVHDIRYLLAEMLENAGVPFSKTFKDFKPHISIVYVPHGEESDLSVTEPEEFHVDGVYLWTDAKRIFFPFFS